MCVRLYQHSHCLDDEKIEYMLEGVNKYVTGIIKMQWHVKLPSHNNCVFGVHIPPEIQAIVVFNVDLYPGLHSKSHVCPG